MRKGTLLFLLKPESSEILLAMKKRGFGTGKYNGAGGKVKTEETVEVAAIREAEEEIGVQVALGDLQKVAELKFFYEQKPDWDIHTFVYTALRWEGEPSESEEMAPKWFDTRDLPFDRMWIDDKQWLPPMLAGKKLDATFHFNSDGSEILKQSIQTV